MIRCPGCSYLVPEAWEACRRCGAALAQPAPVAASVAAPSASASPAHTPPPAPARPAPPLSRPSAAPPPPAPPAPAAAPVAFDLVPSKFDGDPSSDAIAPVAPAPRGPNDLLPLPDPYRPRLPDPPPRKDLSEYKKPAFVTFVVLVVLAWVYVLWPRGGTPEEPTTEVLTEAVGGSRAADAFRVQAEANLRSAITTVQGAYAEQGDLRTITPTALGRYDPSLQYVGGEQPSTSASIVSTSVAGDTVTLAVAGQSGICAFGRVTTGGAVSTVTVRSEEPCRALGAPATGWSGAGAGSGAGVTDRLPSLGGDVAVPT